MRQPKYNISISGVKDYLFYNIKRDVEKYFHKLLRSYQKDSKYDVLFCNEDWFKYTFHGEIGMVEGDAYIARNL